MEHGIRRIGVWSDRLDQLVTYYPLKVLNGFSLRVSGPCVSVTCRGNAVVSLLLLLVARMLRYKRLGPLREGQAGAGTLQGIR